MSAESRACLNNRHRNDDIKCCEGTTIVIVVLLGCGIMALGLSAIIWFFYDVFDAPDAFTSSPIYTTESSNFTTTTTASIPTTTSRLRPSSCEKRIVGYFNESESREITIMQLSKLTHAVFAHLEMSWEGKLGFKSGEAKNRFTDLRSKAKNVETDVKMMVSIVGLDTNFRFIAINKNRKDTFLDSVLSTLETYNIDGIDLQWEREKSSQSHLNLLKELRKSLGDGYIISVTLPAPTNSGASFNSNEILKDVDFVNVITMKYFDSKEAMIAPIAPLYSEDLNSLNVDATMKYFVCETKEPRKFNIVIPFFAKLWNRVKESNLFRNASEGFIEVPQSFFEPSNSSWDKESKSSFAFDELKSTFLTFEDKKSIDAKLDYVNSMNLGGVWIWMVEMDDEHMGLLSAVKSDEFCSTGSENIVKYDCD